jgi:hypothetical protein
MASLFTSEIKGILAMGGQRKLEIPADAATSDASCASSGIETRASRISWMAHDWWHKPNAAQLSFGF